MESTWVDFKAVKEAIPIERVLDRYGLKLKRSGKELRGRCPIHQGEGQDTFHANTEKNAFHCFSCHAKGNVLDFVAAMEKCSVRDAAVKLQQWFQIATGSSGSEKPDRGLAQEQPASSAQLPTERVVGESGEANKPLGFRLKGIDHAHPYLAQRGIEKDTAEYFGVGFFSGRGSMHGRIVIPIENETGELIAYAGRSIDGSEPKYRLPAGFKKSQVLFNLCRALEDGSERYVVLVEGFFDCMRVTQAEHSCIALMGCSMSEQQESQLAAHFRQVALMLDGDQAGRAAAAEVALRLASRLWVRNIDVGEGKQPDQLSTEELRTLFSEL